MSIQCRQVMQMDPSRLAASHHYSPFFLAADTHGLLGQPMPRLAGSWHSETSAVDIISILFMCGTKKNGGKNASLAQHMCYHHTTSTGSSVSCLAVAAQSSTSQAAEEAARGTLARQW